MHRHSVVYNFVQEKVVLYRLQTKNCKQKRNFCICFLFVLILFFLQFFVTQVLDECYNLITVVTGKYSIATLVTSFDAVNIYTSLLIGKLLYVLLTSNLQLPWLTKKKSQSVQNRECYYNWLQTNDAFVIVLLFITVTFLWIQTYVLYHYLFRFVFTLES